MKRRSPQPPEANTGSGTVVSHRNRMGVTFYLHEGRTNTGKTRYFVAKAVGEGALARVPDGFEICESINGVVSVRKIREDDAAIPPEDVAIVQHAVKGCAHLRFYEARVVEGAIVIYEPDPRPEQLVELAKGIGMGRLGRDYVSERMARATYAPVMKFEPEPVGARYAVFRMTYRGHGGWSYPLTSGKLAALVSRFVPKVGTEEFFDLM